MTDFERRLRDAMAAAGIAVPVAARTLVPGTTVTPASASPAAPTAAPGTVVRDCLLPRLFFEHFTDTSFAALPLPARQLSSNLRMKTRQPAHSHSANSAHRPTG